MVCATSLTALPFLYLGNNQLTALPSSINALTCLESLHLYDNALTALPLSLVSLVTLEVLLLEFLYRVRLRFEILHAEALRGGGVPARPALKVLRNSTRAGSFTRNFTPEKTRPVWYSPPRKMFSV